MNMNKRFYKEVYGWLALGSVLVIVLGAALFYHHSTNQSERTPTQSGTVAEIYEAERGDVGGLCVDTRVESSHWGFDSAMVLLNTRLAQESGVRVGRNGEEGKEFINISKPFKVSSPAISSLRDGDHIDIHVCVIITKE